MQNFCLDCLDSVWMCHNSVGISVKVWFASYAYSLNALAAPQIPTELWHIQTESGETPDTLSADTLYEVHVIVEDNGAFDLNGVEKEITVSVVLSE